ncbi:AMP-binding protein [Acholeplasma sp. OttesenSCG-928-E16]|nr:AMP-binding protein [Acholeplasma sp. OttesenSCG-928-E16]
MKLSDEVKREYWTKLMLPEEVELMKELSTFKDFLDYISVYKDRPAIQSVMGLKTYDELLDEVARTRGFLNTIGVKKGDHVAIHMLNEYDFMRLFLAIASYGAVAVLVPMQTPGDRLGGLCKKMDVKFYITNEMFYETVASNVSGVRVFKKELGTMQEPYNAADDLNKDTLAAIMFTGGTTKAPKGVQLTHGNYMRGTLNGTYSDGESYYQRYLNLMPFTHVFGLIRSGLTPLYTGSLLYCCLNPKDMVSDLQVAKPTYMILVPALAEMLHGLAKMIGKEKLIPNLRVIIAGGAPVHPRLSKKYNEFQVSLFGGYGLTESSNLVSGNLSVLRIPEKEFSVGIPYPKQQVKLDENGVILLRGDHITPGYYNDPEINSASFKDGWFYTGDLGKIDEDGYLYIVGRADNLIVLQSGEKVAPEELEAEVNSIPFVKDCLVRSYKNEVGSISLEVEILPNDPVVKAMGIEDVYQAAKAEIDKINATNESYLGISKVTIRTEDFKRSPAMKILRG